MNCQQFQDKIYDHHYELLEGIELVNFRKHLRSCAECRSLVDNANSGLKLLKHWDVETNNTALVEKTLEQLHMAMGSRPNISEWKLNIVEYWSIFAKSLTVRRVAIAAVILVLAYGTVLWTSIRNDLNSLNNQRSQMKNQLSELHNQLSLITTQQQQLAEINKHMQATAKLQKQVNEDKAKLQQQLIAIKENNQRLSQLFIAQQNWWTKEYLVNKQFITKPILPKIGKNKLTSKIPSVLKPEELASTEPKQITSSNYVFQDVTVHPYNTFTLNTNIDSYQKVREELLENRLPAQELINAKEMINYFHYSYPKPDQNQTFSIIAELATCPWNEKNLLLMIGLQGNDKWSNKSVQVEGNLSRPISIAKDVKVQVEFNSISTLSYRLLGYRNYKQNTSLFPNAKTTKDIRSGHTVTIVYEIIPWAPKEITEAENWKFYDELMTLKLYFKNPIGGNHKLLKFVINKSQVLRKKTSRNFRWSAAVAGFAMLLKGSKTGTLSFDTILELANSSLGKDLSGKREEFLKIVKNAESLMDE